MAAALHDIGLLIKSNTGFRLRYLLPPDDATEFFSEFNFLINYFTASKNPSCQVRERPKVKIRYPYKNVKSEHQFKTQIKIIYIMLKQKNI